ncbi:MAG: ADP-glyceromanno-heptose 6-epimerase [Fibrobacteria bacterium]|nr:ADP-glyceromanno-heptose 6-epimerase [Fibrobacteria bacterium]
MIIITGAAGFIGSALAWGLNRRGNTDLLLVDELGQSEKWKNLVPLQYSDYMEKDVFLAEVKQNNIPAKQVEAIIHMGACSSTTESNASYLIQNNFEYTKTLAKWALNHDIRFIYASSAATYGDGTQGYVDDESAIHKLRPLNMYGYSKQMFDLWARKRGHLSTLVGLKYFNVYGPNEYHKDDMRSMVVKAFEQIQSAGQVGLFKSYKPEYRDGEQLRDFIYIKDAINMTLFFLDKNKPGGLYNIGTGTSRSWLDMMKAIFKELKKEPVINFIDMPEVLKEKYQYYTQADIKKLRSAGYKETLFSLETGIADYILHLKNNLCILGA